MGRLRGRHPEGSVMPFDESLEIMKTMNRVRAQWGLCYPAD